MALPKYERANVCLTLINEKEESSRVSSIVSNNKPGYVEKPPFKPLPPEKGKKKKRRSKRIEEKVSSPKHLAPIIVAADESEFENDDVINCYTISTIHVPSNDDMESSKLGDEVFENPFAIDDYIFETSPSSKNDEEYGLDMLYDNALDDGPMLIDNPPCLVVTICEDENDILAACDDTLTHESPTLFFKSPIITMEEKLLYVEK